MPNQPFKLNPGSVVTLFEIDFSKCLGFKPTGTTVLRCTPYKNGDSLIVRGGNTYSYIGVEASGFQSSMNSTAPTPELRFDRPSLYNNVVYQNLAMQYRTQTGEVFFDWRGAQATIIKYYVSGDETVYTQDYIVDQVSNINKDEVTVKLTVSLGVNSLTSESIQTLGLNKCSLAYRKWNFVTNQFDYTEEAANGCPYGNSASASKYTAVINFGTKYYTSDDAELPDANKRFDKCSQTIKGCQLRFDPNKEALNLPFKGLTSPVPKVGDNG